MGNNKRHRSESFTAEQGSDGDARKRLAAFQDRMFDLPIENAPMVASETPQMLLKVKPKKHKKKIDAVKDVGDGEAVPMVTINMKKKKVKKKKMGTAVKVKEEKTTKRGPAVVKTPGTPKSNGIKKKKSVAVSVVDKAQKKQQQSAVPMLKKTTLLQTVAVQAAQWHSIQNNDSTADSLTKAARTKNDMFLSTKKEPIEKAAVSHVANDVSSESEDDDGVDFGRSYGDKTSLFSRLIDSAAREQWELVEVGRLVRLFSAEWDFKERKTARFLCKTCPELVNVDFLEGLGVSLSAKQLVQVFEAGSGNSRVLVNKMSSAVENGYLSVRDPFFVSSLERLIALTGSNAEVMELLHPLLESLSTVRDVGCLLRQLCEHWQLERKIALVQQVLLSKVFDELDGNQDEILLDLPDLTGRLDFPSRLDQEDVDENGNLKGFLADDDSDIEGEEGSEEDVDEHDSEDDEDPFERETDLEDEVEISGRSRGRNQFIEDEADVGDEDDDEVEEEERQDNDSSSSFD